MKKQTFWGGVHPEYNKQPASEAAIQILPAPEQLVVPLQQHVGAPAQALVKKGDEVLAGQRIGEAQGFVSAHVHAPVSGSVAAVEPRPHPSGKQILSVIIDNDGQDRWAPLESHLDPVQLSRDQIKEAVTAAGIVGMGGAGFPTHVKLAPPNQAAIDFFILNGSECEPYLTADHRMMVEYAEDVALGTRLLAKACGAKRVVIGIETNKMDAMQALRKHAGNIEIVPLAVKYPQGGEKQLIKAITGREVPSNGLPHECGVIVQNVGTVLAAAQAVRDGRPSTHRVVTVAGAGVQSPGNFLVAIGTSFQQVIDAAGGTKGTIGKVLSGGPMTGDAQITTEVPVVKATSGILVLSEEQCVLPDPMPCIKCARCADVCPTYLLPMRIERAAILGRWDESEEYGAMDCIECGCCSYICPSKRYLLHYIRLAKNQIATVKQTQSN